MNFSFINQPNDAIFDKNDLNYFKQQQLNNSFLLTKLPLPYTNKLKIEKFFMENEDSQNENTSDDDQNLEDAPKDDQGIQNNNILFSNNDTKCDTHEPKFNINTMMKLESKGTYDAYKGSEIKVNNPPIAPYPFGPK